MVALAAIGAGVGMVRSAVGAVGAQFRPFGSAPSFSSVGTGGVWSTSANALVEDGAVATWVGVGADSSAFLRGVGLAGPAVPGGATITGVEVQYKVDYSVVSGTILFSELWLVVGGVAVGIVKTDPAAVTNVLTNRFLGGSTDMWGTTLTPAQVNSGSFGFQLRAVTSGGAGVSITEVDYMAMRISIA